MLEARTAAITKRTSTKASRERWGDGTDKYPTHMWPVFLVCFFFFFFFFFGGGAIPWKPFFINGNSGNDGNKIPNPKYQLLVTLLTMATKHHNNGDSGTDGNKVPNPKRQLLVTMVTKHSHWQHQVKTEGTVTAKIERLCDEYTNVTPFCI